MIQIIFHATMAHQWAYILILSTQFSPKSVLNFNKYFYIYKVFLLYNAFLTPNGTWVLNDPNMQHVILFF